MPDQNINQPPTLAEFLAGPIDAVRELAPQTLIFAAGGTRRSAAMNGVSTTGNEYAQWAYNQMMACFDLFFKHGVKHIITHAVIPSQYQETTLDYREKLLKWVDWVLAGPAAMAGYQQRGWQVRLWGTENVPEVEHVAQRLRASSAPDGAPMMCFTITPDEEAPWNSLFSAVQRSGATTQAEAIRAQYGDNIPPATLYIGSGKPAIFPAIVPPLLMGKVQCYWMQRPGFILEEETIRTLLYDYAYTRNTWKKDKTGRAEQALVSQQVWQQAPLLGLGMRLGPFWYPLPIAPPPE